MFDITPEHVGRLSDADLRELIGRLCIAEVRKMGASTSAVRYGGDQDAKDDGFDVVVTLPVGYPPIAGGYIPKRVTAFQCKKPSLAAAGITKEMQPKGKLRPSIVALPTRASAYVIVSSGSSTTKRALDARVAAMKEAAGTYAKTLTLAFYDRDHIATWVRDFPGVVVWLRERSGLPLSGWRPYGEWAAKVDEPYIPDSASRVHLKDRILEPVAGITELRKLAAMPAAVVRFVGHSGVGKTRLLQALFDDRIGTDSLDPASAIYTDMELAPDPAPAALLHRLIADSSRAIVVVDNCDSQTHGKLTKICSAGQTNVSLITVEYEIREDQPEGTEVVRVDAASNDLVERVLTLQYPQLGQSNTRRIAQFAGGNLRLARAIADTVRRGQSVAQLQDAQLFHRIFHQRNEDQSLLRAGRIFSLVFSFDGKNTDAASELARLSSLSGVPVDELYRHLAALKKKGIVQTRGLWRAVLPEAIANFLATEALEDYPTATLEAHFREGPERLLKSFSRRLGYLHTSERAVEVAREWLREGGWLSDLGELGDFRQTIFTNITPTVPEEALAAIERAVAVAAGDEALKRLSWCLDVLGLIAFDTNLFERCISIMAKLLGPMEGPQHSRFREDFRGLFHVRYSGTEAAIHQRLHALQDLMKSEVPHQRNVALLGLEETLSTYFQPRIRSDFGARLRGYGYRPAGPQQIAEWFSAAIAFAADLATGEDSPIRDRARKILANQLPGIWETGFVCAELEAACQRISAKEYYWQGWVAVRKAFRPETDEREIDPVSHSQLLRLELDLRPASMAQETVALLLSEEWSRVSLSLAKDWLDGDPNSSEIEDQSVTRAHALGTAQANEEGAVTQILPSLLGRPGAHGRLKAFGQGLAQGAIHRRRTWNLLRKSLLGVAEDQRQLQVIGGFLEGLNACDQVLLTSILDESAKSPELASYLPLFQSCAALDSRGVSRLVHALENGSTETWRFRALWGRVRECTSLDVQRFMVALAGRFDGLALAVDMLANKLQSLDPTLPVDDELRLTGVHLLSLWQFEERDDDFDLDLATIIRYSLRGERGVDIAYDIWRRAPQGEAAFAIGIQCDDTLSALMEVQPIASLNGLLAGTAGNVALGTHFLNFQGRTNPLDVIAIEALLDWCDSDPSIRYPAIAEGITVAHDLNELRVKWSSRAEGILARAPEPQKILHGFLSIIVHPTGWVSSYAQAIECNFHLLDALEGHARKEIKEFLPEARKLVNERLEAAKRREAGRSSQEGSFE